jgi:hypothetical protein
MSLDTRLVIAISTPVAAAARRRGKIAHTTPCEFARVSAGATDNSGKTEHCYRRAETTPSVAGEWSSRMTKP